MKRFGKITTLSGLLLSSAAGVYAQSPAEISSLMTDADKAIRAKSTAPLDALAIGDASTTLKWNHRPGSNLGGMPKAPWHVGQISPPGSAQTFIVFWAVHPCESEGDHIHHIVKDGDKWKIGEELEETDTFGYRIQHHNLNVMFDLVGHAGKFVDTITLLQTKPASGYIGFRISADFPISSIKSGGSTVPFVQTGNVVMVQAPAASTSTMTLTYGGVGYHPDMFVGNFIDKTEVALTSYWYPMIARQPATHSVTVTVPKGWTAIGQGNEFPPTTTGTTQEYKFDMKVPTVYFTLDAGPYYKYAKTVNGRTYRVYLTMKDDVRGNKQVAMMDGSFRLFEKIWGEYPWDKFTIVETAQKGWPGALEAYSFTTYGPGIIPGDNPHEWGHTWWGGFVPNTYLRDIWNESLATYSESVYYRRAKGDAAANAILDRAFWVRPFPGMDRLVGAIPLSESFDALFGSAAVVGYQKGGLVMQNLEETLGYNLLQKCLKAFRTKFMYSGKAAVWADFEEIVNSVTGKDYTWFFNQWVRKAGLPKLALANVKSTSIGGSYEVEGDVTQSGSPYWLKMPIWIATAQGHVKTTVQVDGENTHFKISVPSTPTTVLLDPEIRVPRTLTNNDTPASARSGMDALIITSQSGMDQANKQKRGERTLVLDTKVKDADLKGHDLVIVGNVETNKIWRRLAKSAPFTATATSVAFEGKTYPGASASGSITSPFDGEYRVFFITETGHSTIPSGLGTVSNPLSVSIFDKGGNLLAGRLALPTKGSGVFQLK